MKVGGVCGIFMFLFVSISRAGKYSEDVNKPLTESKKPFRMNKVNMIWNKAQKRLSRPRLADLYADLTIQDKVERELKKLKAEDRDKDGMKEAEVRQRLLEIINRYGLQDVISVPPSPTFSNEIPQEFHDKKLQKMWKKAELSGFTDEELKQLKEEFWHQQNKLDEYNSLKEEGFKFDDLMDNSLDPYQDKTFDKMSKTERQMELKRRNKDLNDQYRDLHENLDKPGDEELEFTDHRVYELWALAKKANMSHEELAEFKMELQHFQRRISKHDYYQDQLSYTEDLLKDDVKQGEFPEKHAEIKQRAQNMEKTVRKYHVHLKDTVEKAINKRHTEL
ncbi:alpha-2-macroglobulin receptor-associated protein-like [Mizuhopecten yessoensis]|uniref:Alpha-2-macroglobulin receptor-associated protein n=1 Tax=Mizuhopecten yessoensis TaxID=6573 RepID=A0A210R569_MIZYE|nr:alpha-2-macroglobulin receptor-associated protein-like [Mizuhopecten yessoensis]OWF56213.1 Alpha-2-macroglobulin receptor-associated protein [Mizuhopecten yessoensis]